MSKSKVLPLVISVTNPPVEADVNAITTVREVMPLTVSTGSETITIVLPSPSDG